MSSVVWLIGVVAVPVGVLAIFRANHHGWLASAVASVVAVLAFALLSVLLAALYLG